MNRSRIRSGAAALIAVAAAFFASGNAFAQADSRSVPSEGFEDSRWIPAIALQTGFLVPKREGKAESLERGSIDGDATPLYGLIGASAELSTPRLAFIPGRPRFFAHADTFFAVDKKESLTSEGDPGNPLLDTTAKLENNAAIEGVLGVGTLLQTQSEPLVLSGGLGLSFTTEAGGRAVRIKPSLEWMYNRDEIRLAFADVESTGTDPDGPCNPCRVASAQSQTTKGFHSLGPGLEIDVDAGRIGDFSVSVFSQFRALRVLGDRKAQIQTTGSWFTREIERIDGANVITSIAADPTREDSTAGATYERDAWGYFAAAGVRIHWGPK